ncbi:MAG TPA: hypothetical protein PKE15_00110 [Ottowia sp.]|nr:hypothetical protein [Ottowia sp.]
MKWSAGVPLVPVNLTGCTARMHVRSAINSPDVLLDLNTSNGRIVLGATDGTIRFVLNAEETAALDWRNGVYDMEVVMATGRVRRLLMGRVRVDPEATR